MKGMRSYLNNIKPGKAGANCGNRDWLYWHGDNKSQSNAFAGQLTFQIWSMQNTGGQYVTIVTERGKKDIWFVKYESYTWDDAGTIINAIVNALVEKKIK